MGNACFPLAEVMPKCQIYAIDFSQRAVDLLKTHPEFKEDQIMTAVVNVTEPDWTVALPSMDFCLMIFVLSAISPQKMPDVIRNLGKVMKKNQGRVLFRDYAVGDLTQLRFEQGRQKKKLGENFYLRRDGTRCYYFTEDILKSLFEKEGFVCEKMTVHERQIKNRQRENITMNRKWIQAVFLKL